MDEKIMDMLTMHALNGAQGQADGARLYAENLRYDYLEGKANVSMTEGLGVRHVEESGAGRARQTDNTAPANR